MPIVNGEREKECGLVPPEKVWMEIDASILNKLVRAGMGKDRSAVVTTALMLADVVTDFKDTNGNVHIQKRGAASSPGNTVAVHAFTPTRSCPM